jgi:hypothetical protein
VRGGRQLGRGGMQAGGDSRLDRGRARPSRVRRGTQCRAGPSRAGGVHAGRVGACKQALLARSISSLVGLCDRSTKILKL